MPVTPKAKATAARIAACAGDLFLQNGYAKTTVADVAVAADVAVGTVLLHFGSKSGLATAAFAERIAEVVEGALATLPGSDLIGDVAFLVGELYEWYRVHDRVAVVLLREALFSEGTPAEAYAETVAATVAAFDRIVAAHVASEPSIDGRVQGGAGLLGFVGQGLLADYLLVLLQGLHGQHSTTEAQVAHFVRLAAPRLAALPNASSA